MPPRFQSPASRRSLEPAQAPPVVRDVVRSPGHPLDARTRSELEAHFGHDFSRVRVHTDDRAIESAHAVNALAYTVGRDVVFDSGRYAPHTHEGRRLLVHELAHVVQQRDADTLPARLEVGAADATAEAEAERAASGPSRSFAATPIVLRRDEGEEEEEVAEEPAEESDLEARRVAAADGLRIAIDRIRTALQRGYLFQYEALEGESIRSMEGNLETRAAREARLRGLLNDLRDLLVRLDSGAVPGDWFNPQTTDGSLTVGVHGGQPWRDAGALYLHRQVSLGRDLAASGQNVWYIQFAPVSERRTRPAPFAAGIQTGLYLLVRDPENAPLEYERVSKTTAWSAEGVIVEVWRDDLGYYYPYGGKKIYLPGRP